MRQKRLCSLDETEFETKLSDGRIIEVHASGKVIGTEGFSTPHVTDLFLDCWHFLPNDLDGTRLGLGDMVDDLDRLEQLATDKLIEKVLFYRSDEIEAEEAAS